MNWKVYFLLLLNILFYSLGFAQSTKNTVSNLTLCASQQEEGIESLSSCPEQNDGYGTNGWRPDSNQDRMNIDPACIIKSDCSGAHRVPIAISPPSFLYWRLKINLAEK